MHMAAAKTDYLEVPTYGIHHGRRPAHKHGRPSAATLKKLLEHVSIQTAGFTLEIPLLGQHVVDRKVGQFGLHFLKLLWAEYIGLGSIAPNERQFSAIVCIDQVAEHAEHRSHPYSTSYHDKFSI